MWCARWVERSLRKIQGAAASKPNSILETSRRANDFIERLKGARPKPKAEATEKEQLFAATFGRHVWAYEFADPVGGSSSSGGSSGSGSGSGSSAGCVSGAGCSIGPGRQQQQQQLSSYEDAIVRSGSALARPSRSLRL